jgi:DNA-binding NarL/FixJ family response regulator
VTVCLVDDHADVRRHLSDLLTGAGVDVLSAVGTVSEGEATVRQLLPDVAVIDNRLPDGRGIDLCRRLSTLTPEVGLLLHTSTVTDEEAIEAGVAAIILKSIRSEGLLDAIVTFRPDLLP